MGWQEITLRSALGGYLIFPLPQLFRRNRIHTAAISGLTDTQGPAVAGQGLVLRHWRGRPHETVIPAEISLG